MSIPSAEPGSVIENLRANRARLLSDKDTVLKLPGWGSLYARYKRLPWDTVKALQGLGSGDSTVEVGTVIEVLIAACDEMVFRDADGEQPLGLRYEQGLAELIGDEDAKTPPEVVAAVFTDEGSLMVHGSEYLAWSLRLEDEATASLGKPSGQTGQ